MKTVIMKLVKIRDDTVNIQQNRTSPHENNSLVLL